MKNLMYSILFLGLMFFTCGCTSDYIAGMPNPWVDCGNDIVCAKKVSGLEIPAQASKYNIRAMKDMIEIKFLLDDDNITLRKSAITEDADISGDYNEYPVNDRLEFKGVEPYFFTRGDKNNIYVVNFEDFGYDYSVSSKKGIKSDDVLHIYNLIKNAETSK